MRRVAARSEVIGAAVIYIMSVLLHYVYDLSGGSALGMVFGAVNESVWEHVKIFSISYMGWAMLQLLYLRLPFKKYAVSKCIGLYALMGSMIGFYYIYTAIVETNIPLVDIISSLVFVIASQALSFVLETGENSLGELFVPAVLMVFVYYLMFLSFTAFPPRLELFRDPTDGSYGINSGLAGQR